MSSRHPCPRPPRRRRLAARRARALTRARRALRRLSRARSRKCVSSVADARTVVVLFDAAPRKARESRGVVRIAQTPRVQTLRSAGSARGASAGSFLEIRSARAVWIAVMSLQKRRHVGLSAVNTTARSPSETDGVRDCYTTLIRLVILILDVQDDSVDPLTVLYCTLSV